ncbi:MAG: peptidylprolyl isomerase [Pseudomonadota bacterium]
MKVILLCLALFVSTPSHAQDTILYTFATLKTSLGDIRLKLFKKDAPKTVENFVGLAKGSKSFRDVKTGVKMRDTPFYKNLLFHKVHPELAIQTGCPWGNGKGWPGFTLKAEKNEIKFDRPYLLAMAQIQGNQNSIGSQFFITTKITPHLNGDYTVFGEVVSGFELVDEISQARRDAMMKPLEPVTLIEVTIENG